MAKGLKQVMIGKDNKPKVVHSDPTKQAFVNILEFLTNNFFSTDENTDIAVRLSKSGNGKHLNYYDTKQIVLAEELVDAFGELNLPRFLIYYHELGHHIYSQGMFLLREKWIKITGGSPIDHDKKYDHIENWIEDFYVEQAIVTEYPYLTDVINCIKKLPPDYDIYAIENAFNFYYIKGAPSQTLAYPDQVQFKDYVDKLLALRINTTTRFGNGILSMLSIRKSRETRYIELLIEFYNWCESVGIFDPANPPLPPLSNPNGHVQPTGPGQKGGQPGGGTSSPHSQQVGKVTGYKEVYHITNPTNIFKDELARENKMIQKELLDMSQRMQADNHTLDGLFSTRHKDSSIIQPKIILPNFFNPHRLIDQVLFRQKQHTYMNAAIYRDISGSTEGKTHTLMEHVTARLHREIPVDITYYLYGSGDISIVEMPYTPWLKSGTPPTAYKKNPIFNDIYGGGTNSDAIADVITQQMSEKWLNIIITDGDLSSLMARDNILGLLRNVFVVSVHAPVEPGLLGIEINDRIDIENINTKLSTINLDRAA
jgi:hypothetical protein